MTSIPSLAPFRKPNAPVPPVRAFKKTSAIQMLDIGEQPLGRDAKRKKAKEEKEEKEKEIESSATPDYAAGLTSMIPPSPAPVYAPPTPAPIPSSHDIGPSLPVGPSRKVATIPQKTDPPMLTQQPQVTIPQPNLQSQQGQLNQQPQPSMQMNPIPQPQLVPAPQLQVQQQRPQMVQQGPTQQQRLAPQVMPQQQIQVPGQILQSQVPGQILQSQIAGQIQQAQIPGQIQQQPRQFQQAPQQQGQQFMIGADRKPVHVTPELRAAVAEVFRGANRATKPEKALIVGFICGSKENPCPQLGHIVTIKLGDHIEKVTYPDGTETYSFVEMHYQMNYQTGEGKKLKKPRPLTQQEIQQLHMQQAASMMQQQMGNQQQTVAR